MEAKARGAETAAEATEMAATARGVAARLPVAMGGNSRRSARSVPTAFWQYSGSLGLFSSRHDGGGIGEGGGGVGGGVGGGEGGGGSGLGDGGAGEGDGGGIGESDGGGGDGD
eukprot:scaffold37332_cov21-Phaeocystis_antarctica.AAC.1